jgi:hypothetical protein
MVGNVKAFGGSREKIFACPNFNGMPESLSMVRIEICLYQTCIIYA